MSIAPPLPAHALAPVLDDLGIDAGNLVTLPGDAGSGVPTGPLPDSAAEVALGSVRIDLAPGATPPREIRGLAEDGALLCVYATRPDERTLAAHRASLWPRMHAVAIYEIEGGVVRRRTVSEKRDLGPCPGSGLVLALRRRAHVMSPDATSKKFDANASGWDGIPGTPGYPHFRWMRRYVGLFATPPVSGRILDFGCGAGWVGIEAALAAPGSELAFFDPSPEMVRIAEQNAAGAGLARYVGRTGFGERPPFPAGNEQPFDLVISSGVISFSPEPETWLDGLASCVRPGGALVIGDIHGGSRGFAQRRASKPLLPVRELNAARPAEVRAGLERRGFKHLETAYYQLTRPVPQLMHLNETRLRGVLTYPLLVANRCAAATNRRLGLPGPAAFDSWVQRFVLPR